MALTPQKFREIVFQALYSLDMGDAGEKDLVPLLMKELSTSRKNVSEAFERASIIQRKSSEIDPLIYKNAKEYNFERIPSVERNVLRLAFFEMIHDDEIPEKVAIAEGIRLARKFSTRESATFINGVLDQAYQELLNAQDRDE